jgi:hypothetical protein
MDLSELETIIKMFELECHIEIHDGKYYLFEYKFLDYQLFESAPVVADGNNRFETLQELSNKVHQLANEKTLTSVEH